MVHTFFTTKGTLTVCVCTSVLKARYLDLWTQHYHFAISLSVLRLSNLGGLSWGMSKSWMSTLLLYSMGFCFCEGMLLWYVSLSMLCGRFPLSRCTVWLDIQLSCMWSRNHSLFVHSHGLNFQEVDGMGSLDISFRGIAGGKVHSCSWVALGDWLSLLGCVMSHRCAAELSV